MRIIDKVEAETDKQYDEMYSYIIGYTNDNRKIEKGQIHFYSNTEVIIPKTETREFIISGRNKENINEIKRHLEYIVQTEKRDF